MRIPAFFVIVVLFAQHLHGQSIPTYRETLILHTNTSEVFAGDFLHLIVKGNSNLEDQSFLSEFVHIDLYKNGEVVSRHLLAMTNGIGQGSIKIDSDVSTGYYTLVVYSKWMLNASKDSGIRKRLAVINPLLPYTAVASDAVNQQQDVMKIDGTYKTNTRANIELSKLDIPAAISDVTISVAAKSLVGLAPTTQMATTHPIFQLSVQPEFRGLVVEGNVAGSINKSTSLMLYDEETKYTQGLDIGNDGHFVANVPKHAFSKLWVMGNQPLELKWHSPTVAVSGEKEVLLLSADQLMAIKDRFEYAQLKNAFFTDAIQPNGQISYKGIVHSTYDLQNDFVPMETTELIFSEIVYGVKFKRTDGHLDIAILHQSGQYLNQQPLILVDGKPLLNFQQLLKIVPESIRTISVTREQIFINGVSFGGLIQIERLENKRDHLEAVEFAYPDMLCANLWNETNSDARRSLPNVNLQLLWRYYNKLPNDVSFYTPDRAGTYTLTVNGVRPSGEIYTVSYDFEVSE